MTGASANNSLRGTLPGAPAPERAHGLTARLERVTQDDPGHP